MPNILTGFLTAGLLPIGEDDEKLKLLELAAADIAKQISDTPLRLHRFALVAFNATIPASDPVHVIANTALTTQWQTITNKVGPEPVQVYRAIILRALELTAADSLPMRFAITLIAASQSPSTRAEKEQTAIQSMLHSFESGLMNAFHDTWVAPIELAWPKPPTKAKKPHNVKDELFIGLGRAAGPNDKEGQPIADANKHWPNTGEPWSKEFVPRATEAIHAALQATLKNAIEEMQESIRQTVQSLTQGFERMSIRDAKSELLWIRTSLYSPSKGCSYRTLELSELVLHAVLDTTRAVNGAAPPSVAFFLRELVSSLSTKKVRLADSLVKIGLTLKSLPEADALLKDTLGFTGRRGLLSYAISQDARESFEEQTGFKDTYEESAADLAVRLHREFQILKLLSSQ